MGESQWVAGRPWRLCRSAVTAVLSIDDVARAAWPTHLKYCLLTVSIHGSSFIAVIILATCRADGFAHSIHAKRSSSEGRSCLGGCSLMGPTG